jgi:hypothetical protein
MSGPAIALLFGLIGGLLGASLYEASRIDAGHIWNGRHIHIVETHGEFTDDTR